MPTKNQSQDPFAAIATQDDPFAAIATQQPAQQGTSGPGVKHFTQAQSPQEYQNQQQDYAHEISQWYGAGMPATRPATAPVKPAPRPSFTKRVSDAVGGMVMSPIAMALQPKETMQSMLQAGDAGANELARGSSEPNFSSWRYLPHALNALDATAGGDPEAGRQDRAAGNYGSAAADYLTAPAVGAAASLIHPGAGESLMDTARSLPEAGRSLVRAPGEVVRRVIAGNVDKPSAELGGVSPSQRYNTAKGLGVNFDAATATNSFIPKVARYLGDKSLFGGGVYDRARAANGAALEGASNHLLDQMSTQSPEEGGRLIQDKLRTPFVDLQNRTHDFLNTLSPKSPEEGGADIQNRLLEDQKEGENGPRYQALQENVGDRRLKSFEPARGSAKNILNEQAGADKLAPHLVPKQTRAILQDFASMGTPPPAEKPTAFGLLDRVANPEKAAAATQPPPKPTVGQMINLRSRLLDEIQTNKEMTGGEAVGSIKRQIEAVHEGIANALSGPERDEWEELNQRYKDNENTYDNPKSPFYHAIRTESPSTLVKGIGGQSPEAVSAMRLHLGDQGLAPVRRGVAEDLLGRTPTGEYDLDRLPSRLNKGSEGYRAELFGPHEESLQQLGKDHQRISPFEKASITSNPEELVHGKGLGPRTAAAVRSLRDVLVQPEGALGPAAPRIGEQGMGALQRGVAEELLGRDRNNQFNFKGVGRKLFNTSPEYRNELFGEHAQPLEDVARTANALDYDPNRSGTAGQAMKYGEGSSLFGMIPEIAAGHPELAAATAAYHGAQYLGAHLMNSPKVVDWLMKPKSSGSIVPRFPVQPYIIPPSLGPQAQEKKSPRLIEGTR